MANLTSEYISCACNRTPHAVDWNTYGIILYATCRSIAVYDPKYGDGAGIVNQTLSFHKGRVNSVRWIKNLQGLKSTYFISSSSDNSCILWKKSDSNYAPVGKPLCHDAIVNIADGIEVRSPDSTGKLFIASASAGSDVKIWMKPNDTDEINLIQNLDLNRGFTLDLKFTVLPSSGALILACAGEDSLISIWLWHETDGQFVNVLKLTGHEDWVRGLDFTIDDSGDVLLGSCSQDNLVRVWRISLKESTAEESENKIKLKKVSFEVTSQKETYIYYVTLETVLSGHENWIYGIQWHPPVTIDSKCHQPMKLLTASMDKTMIMWCLDEETGIWIDKVRVGEVGGNTLGFYGCKFSPNGQSIMAHGYQGAFHLWHQSETDVWNPGVTVSGHFSEVQDIAWDIQGRFLLSSSSDQTTRLHAPWVKNDKSTTWHEVGRPQVHGYDMTCLDISKDYLLVSGADEKVLRTFMPPKNFIENLQSISQIDLKQDISSLPEGANVPSLGLSNKAIYEDDIAAEKQEDDEERHPKDIYPEFYFKPSALNVPPTEEHLLQNTLWPEVQKLYGHGYELFCVAVNNKYNLIASACKASQTEHATIIIWDIKTWQPTCHLNAHKLTVTQLAFSPNGKYLLSVSRDRTWSLHEVTSSPQTMLKLAAKSSKETFSHSRIIWACAWTHDSEFFVTVSRDKKMVIWGKDEEKGKIDARHVVSSFHDSVTAVNVAPFLVKQQYLIASGLDDGTINLHLWDHVKNLSEIVATVTKSIGHDMTVKRLKFRPQMHDSKDGEQNLNLASCGSDFSVRLFKIVMD